jgi:hypothetical protein
LCADDSDFEAIYQLNRDKTQIYQKNLELFQTKLLAEHPVILALFSSQGGRLILYRPGHEPLEAPQVPKEYQIVKSIGHSTLALYSFAISDTEHPKKLLENYLTNHQKALLSLEKLQLEAQLKNDAAVILKNNISAIQSYLKQDSISLEDIRRYTAQQLPYIQKMMERATDLQVGHWINVLNDWKNLLGGSFEQAYGVASSVYVTRSRNILYTILAQFFREEAFNDRLLLLETTDFAISPEAVLAELTRIVSDRMIGDLFFGGKFEMDVELLGKAARKALEKHADKLELSLLLPVLKPADDLHRWPW